MEALKSKVTCPQCHKLYDGDSSKLLPCLHTFCVDCLRKLPVSQTTSLPQEQTPTGEHCSRSLAMLASQSQPILGTPEVNNSTESSGRRTALTLSLSKAPRSSSVSDPGSPVLLRCIECPKCLKQHKMPEKGVDGFQTSLIVSDLVSTFKSLENYGQESGPRCCHCIKSPLAVAYCQECHYFICKDCVEMHRRWKQYESHTVVPLESLQQEGSEDDTSSKGLGLYQQLLEKHGDSSSGSKFPAFLTQPRQLHEIKCLHHSDERVKFYCHLCHELLCHDCTILAHREHPVVSITDQVLSDHKSRMSSTLTTFDDIFQQLDEKAGNNLNEKEKLVEKVTGVKDLIVATFKTLEEAITKRKEQLVADLSELEKEPLQKLEEREFEIDQIRNHVMESKAYIEDNLLHTGPTSMLSVERTILEHADSISSEFDDISPLEKPPQFEFCHDDHFIDSIPSFGQLNTLPPEDAVFAVSSSHDTVSLPPSFLSGSKLSNRLSFVSSYQSDFYGSLEPSDSGTQYDSVSQLPSDSSSAQNDDTVSSDFLFSTHFSISVSKVKGDPVRVITDVEHPSGITSTNHLVVCEFGSDHKISILSHQGLRLHTFGAMGCEDGQFLHPQCVAVDSGGKMFVTDSNYRVQVFDAHGQWLKSIGKKGKGELQFKDPVGIAIGPNRQVFVCERENNRIQVLNSDLSHHSFIGKKGKHSLEFNQPTDIAVDPYGLLFVVDSWNHRIQVLTQEGVFVREIGSKGTDSGKLLSPSHICVDPDGFIFVSELRNHRISMFTKQGDFVKCFGEKGSGLGQLLKPRGVALDLNKILYVSDYGNNRIHVFK